MALAVPGWAWATLGCFVSLAVARVGALHAVHHERVLEPSQRVLAPLDERLRVAPEVRRDAAHARREGRRAFLAQRGELALMRRAIEGLAAERASIDVPDYSETLGHVVQRLDGVNGRLDQITTAIVKSPALAMTPAPLNAASSRLSQPSRCCRRHHARRPPRRAAAPVHRRVVRLCVEDVGLLLLGGVRGVFD